MNRFTQREGRALMRKVHSVVKRRARSRRARWTGVVGALLVSMTFGGLPAVAVPAKPKPAVQVDEAAKTVTMCGLRYCAVFDGDGRAMLSTLTVDGHQLLDPGHGIHSSVTLDSGEVSSRSLAEDPAVTVSGSKVTVSFSTTVADETWTFDAGAEELSFDLHRRYRAAAKLVQQGTPKIVLAEQAVDQVRWPEDGGNFPVGGRLVNTHQTSWLGAGAQYTPGLRTAKDQISYDLLDAASGTALRIAGSSGHTGVSRPNGTEVWRSQTDHGKSLNLAVVTSASGLQYAGPNPLGYGYQSTRNGSPVYKPVQVSPQKPDQVTLRFAPADRDAFYDLGTLKGVEEERLSAAINDYGRWMMQDVDKGASTEQPQLQSEVPPLEMHWIIQMLEMFPEPGALRSLEKGLSDIRDHLTEPSGRVFCCHPGIGATWGHDYGDHIPSYAMATAQLYQLTGNKDWLSSMDAAVNRSLDYLIKNWTDPATHFVRNVNPNLDESDYDNDYWESSSGTFNAYSTVLLYDAVSRWAALERDVLGNAGRAAYLSSVAATIKNAVNKNVADGGFWSPATKTFLYGSGNQDALYLPVNAAVLKTDITSRERRRQIVDAIEKQNADGNYDLHPMNVRDLYVKDQIARTAGKGGENGGWYGPPDGDYYAGLPLLDDPQTLQTAAASFLTRYQVDGFHGASTWDRDDPTSRTAAAHYFPNTVLPAWGLYRYGYGFQPADDRLVLAPYISEAMTGSTVNYTWRGTGLSVGYPTQTTFRVAIDGELPTPMTVRWINQQPNQTYAVTVSGQPQRTVVADADGNVEATVPAGTSQTVVASCPQCRATGTVHAAGDGAITAYDPTGAELRADRYDQVGMQVAVGPRPVEVTSLGRYKAAGNGDVHRVKLLDVNGRILASAPVDMSGTPDRSGFVSAKLTWPVTLDPGIYYVLSSETPGGDSWYDAGGALTSGDGVTVLGAAIGRARTVETTGTTAYGPVTFGYKQAGEPKPWIQALVQPASQTAGSGGQVDLEVTVWGQHDRPITGTIEAVLPEGWSATSQSYTVPTDGAVASTTVRLKVSVAADAATASYPLTVAVTGDGLRSERPVNVAVANKLFDFDDGTVQGWKGGPGVAGVRAVKNMANGPGTPQEGPYLLEFDGGQMNGRDPRTIFVEPAQPLDLSRASAVYAHVNSYGAWPHNPESYQATITLYSGTDKISKTTEYEANVWNRIGIDVSSWSGAGSVTRIEVTYQVNLDAQNYRLYFDLDSVGFDI